MAKEETIQVQGKVTPHHEGMKDEGGGMKADGLIHPSSLIPHPSVASPTGARCECPRKARPVHDLFWI
jgi:hypothetical protein